MWRSSFPSQRPWRKRGTSRAGHRHLGAALDTFFLADGDEEEDLQALRRALTDLALLQSQSGLDERLGAGVLKAHLEEALREVGLGFGFITGGVTFCAMLPMRSIPFRVICLIGLDDGAYPRQTRVPGFDLMKEHPRPGDRSRRLDDRYLFLEAMLSARENFYISYAGQSIQDNSVRPPSVLVSELLDAIEQGFETPGRDIGDAIVTQHRLQAFSPGYFRGERLFSYSAENAAAALSAVAGRREKLPFISSNLPEPQPAWRSIDVQALVRFYANPARWLLNRRLGIRLEEAGAFLDDVEPMSLEGLESYELGELLAARCLEGIEARDLLPAARALGSLPPGTPGECGFQEICEGVEAFAARLRPHLLGEPLGAVDLMRARALQAHGQDAARIAFGPCPLPVCVHQGEGSASLVDPSPGAQRRGLRPLSRPLRDHRSGQGLRPRACRRCGKHPPGSCSRSTGEGSRGPCTSSPIPRRAYMENLLKGKTGEEALKPPGRTWASDQRALPRGSDPYYRLCFDGQDPLDGEFAELATAILKPLLERAGEEG